MPAGTSRGWLAASSRPREPHRTVTLAKPEPGLDSCGRAAPPPRTSAATTEEDRELPVLVMAIGGGLQCRQRGDLRSSCSWGSCRSASRKAISASVLPAVIVFGLGLTLVVAPVTATAGLRRAFGSGWGTGLDDDQL